jgi:4-amino-4-deoxychorismate lyase
VLEEQHYSAAPQDGSALVGPSPSNSAAPALARPLPPHTFVTTTFSYRSSLGTKKQDRAAVESAERTDGGAPRRLGSWISGWGATRLQRSIESIASTKTDDQLIKSRDGMGMVLERLRNNSVVSVLRELRRRDGKVAFDQ